mmetsp:Transcript_64315/g.130687  ORF Transcript_64315/g.130687 Transcript_64315/m.130687 type:complete len:81 (-) Transcript_64315:465-707(-)
MSELRLRSLNCAPLEKHTKKNKRSKRTLNQPGLLYIGKRTNLCQASFATYQHGLQTYLKHQELIGPTTQLPLRQRFPHGQ